MSQPLACMHTRWYAAVAVERATRWIVLGVAAYFTVLFARKIENQESANARSTCEVRIACSAGKTLARSRNQRILRHLENGRSHRGETRVAGKERSAYNKACIGEPRAPRGRESRDKVEGADDIGPHRVRWHRPTRWFSATANLPAVPRNPARGLCRSYRHWPAGLSANLYPNHIGIQPAVRVCAVVPKSTFPPFEICLDELIPVATTPPQTPPHTELPGCSAIPVSPLPLQALGVELNSATPPTPTPTPPLTEFPGCIAVPVSPLSVRTHGGKLIAAAPPFPTPFPFPAPPHSEFLGRIASPVLPLPLHAYSVDHSDHYAVQWFLLVSTE